MSAKVERMKKDDRELLKKVLFETAKSMKGEKAVADFINKFLTESEQITIGRRLLIARLLLLGEKQTHIRYRLGVSPNTFIRIKKWLDGEISEYNKALKDYDAAQNYRKQKSQKRYREYTDPLSFAVLKKKYPAHFLFFNIADAIIDKFRK